MRKYIIGNLFVAFSIDVETPPEPTPPASPSTPSMSLDELWTYLRQFNVYTPASAFEHIADEDELGRALHTAFDTLDICDPDTRALIDLAKGSFFGALVAGRIAPTQTVGQPRRLPRKPKRQHKSLIRTRPSLFDLID